jgi:hypothetical protein
MEERAEKGRSAAQTEERQVIFTCPGRVLIPSAETESHEELSSMFTSVLTLAALAIAQPPPPPPLDAFRMPQQVVNQPTAQTQVAAVPPPPTFNFSSNPYLYGSGYGAGYGGGYYPGRAGGFLNGVAAVTTANAQSYGTIQEARIVQQQANQSQLDTRRKILNEWQYEQSLRPNPEDVRIQEQAQALRRARNDPPRVEIWSGTAINSLFKAIQKGQEGGLRGPLVPLDPEMLRHINLTSGTTQGGVGLFRDGGKLQWPLVLKSQDYEAERKKMDTLAPLAVQQAMSGQVADETLEGLGDVVASLRTKVDAAARDMAPNKWVTANRYVKELDTTVKALQDPNVSKQFNGTWSARGTNVASLVDQLTQQGLKFAPAAPGDEPSYTVLYNALVTYDMGLAQLAYRPGGQ